MFCKSPSSHTLITVLFRYGRATIYMAGLAGMFVCLVVIGGMGFSAASSVATAVAIMFVISTLINMITVGPVCYAIVSETPSGPLRYKTIVIGRSVYNITGIINNILVPRMVQENGESSCPTTLTDSLELGRENWSLLCRYQSSLSDMVLVPLARDQGSQLWRD